MQVYLEPLGWDQGLLIVSIVVPFWGLPFRILNIEVVLLNQKKELQWRLQVGFMADPEDDKRLRVLAVLRSYGSESRAYTF